MSSSQAKTLCRLGVGHRPGFLFGWLIFQVVPMMAMQGQTFRQALKGAFAAEFLSLTTMVIGMFPTMYWLMGMGMEIGGGGAHMAGPTTLCFWGAVAAGIAVGFLFTYPVNWWIGHQSEGMSPPHFDAELID
jgi:hypothetical protein